MSTPGWLGRLAAVRNGGAVRPAPPPPEEASTSGAGATAAAAQPPASAPSPGTQAKAEATKKYIENMYRERDKAAVQRLERRRSFEKDQTGGAVRHAPRRRGCFLGAPRLLARRATRAHPR